VAPTVESEPKCAYVPIDRLATFLRVLPHPLLDSVHQPPPRRCWPPTGRSAPVRWLSVRWGRLSNTGLGCSATSSGRVHRHPALLQVVVRPIPCPRSWVRSPLVPAGTERRFLVAVVVAAVVLPVAVVSVARVAVAVTGPVVAANTAAAPVVAVAAHVVAVAAPVVVVAAPVAVV